MKKTLIALVITLASPAAFATAYLGGSYAYQDYSEDGIEKDLNFGTVSLVGGYAINQYVAIEVRAGLGVSDDSYMGFSIELDNYYGGYLRFGVPTGNFYPYAMIGVNEVELNFSGRGYSVSGSESDVSYGAGVGYIFNQNISANLEYTRFMDKDAITIEGFTIGINYHF